MDKTDTHSLFFAQNCQSGICTIDESQYHHAMHVLRLKIGDFIRISDGVGSLWQCTVDREFEKKGICKIGDRQTVRAVAPAITCYIGLPEHDAFDEAVQNLAAMGVARVVPVECRFSQTKWWKKDWAKCYERLLKKVVAGARQALYPFLLTVDRPAVFGAVAEGFSSHTLVADQHGLPLAQECSCRSDKEISIVIGPPGGFAADEIALFQKQHCAKVSIGSTRLRTELAAVVACGVVRNLCC